LSYEEPGKEHLGTKDRQELLSELGFSTALPNMTPNAVLASKEYVVA
jgi:hypothetical protein